MVVPISGSAGLPDNTVPVFEELGADPPLVLNTFKRLTVIPVEALRAFSVDTRGILTLLETVGIREPLTIVIRADGMEWVVNGKPLVPDDPAFPAALALVFPGNGDSGRGGTLPKECDVFIRDAVGNPRARCKARFHLFPVPEVNRFIPILHHVDQGRVTMAAAWCVKQKRIFRYQCFNTLAWILFHKGDYAGAARYWEQCKSVDRAAGFQALGDAFFHNRRYKVAIGWYDRIDPSGNRARTCGILADLERESGNHAGADKWMKRAVEEYDFLIKSPEFTWADIDIQDRLRCLGIWSEREKSHGEKARAARMKRLLSQCAVYCRKLYNASFDFVCVEKERRKMGGRGSSVDYFRLSLKSPTESGSVTYEYDYRLKRKDRKITEVRTLMRRNGRKVDENSVDSQADHPDVEKIVFGPVAVLGGVWQPYFRFRILGEEVLGGEQAVILDVIPRKRMEKNRIFGRVWVHEADGSVLKIEFNPKSLVNFESVRFLMRNDGAVPDMVSIAEYGMMRRGIRFPSRYLFEDAYIKPGGKRKVRFRVGHEYTKYHFFSINSEVKYKGEI